MRGQRSPKLWIVSGPTSAGKSRLLSSPRAGQLTSLEPGAPVLFPPKLGKLPELSRDSYLHYNLLRPAQIAAKEGDAVAGATDFGTDPRWRQILDLSADRRAVILVAGRETLMNRSRGRTLNEPDRKRRYKPSKWLALYEQVDLDDIYRAWREELARQRIPYVEVDAEAESFPVLGGEA